MKIPDTPVNEAARLRALADYAIMDSEDEAGFDELTRLASRILNVPITLVSLVDEQRQWFKSRQGLDVSELSREISFCGHAVAQGSMFLVPDAHEDERFHDNPLVTGAPRIRFYVGMPLQTPEGHVLGTLCAIDHVPRVITDEQQELLRILAHQVMGQMELRRHVLQLEAQRQTIATRDKELRAMFLGMVEGVVMQNATGLIVSCNPAAEEIFGLSKEQIMGKKSPDPGWRLVQEDQTDFPFDRYPAMVALKTARPQSNTVMGIQKPSGELTWIQIHAEPILNHGVAESVVTTFRDITGHRALVAELAHRLELERELSRTDALTNLRNRRAFDELAEYVLAAADRSERPFTLAYLDLDDFKALNDSRGHATGDEALQLVAAVLIKSTRRTDVIARIGGDEFVLLLAETSEAAAQILLARVVNELCDSMAQRDWPVTASVGAITFRKTPSSLQAALELADAAMYRAKAAGKNRVVVEAS